MSRVAVQIKGLEKLTTLASRFPAISQKFIDEAIVRSIGEIQRQALPLTPVKTSRLISDLRVPHFAPFEGAVGSNLPYAADVHDRYPAGQKYKRPSLNKNAVAGFLSVGVKQAKTTIDDAFSSALNKITEALAKG